MVNQDVVDYLKEGKKRGFSVHLLKKKLLEGGFQEQEVEEAIASVEVDEKKEAMKTETRRRSLFETPSDMNSMAEKTSPFSSKPTSSFAPSESPMRHDEKDNMMSSSKGSSGFKWMKTAAICGIILFVAGLSYGIIAAVSPSTSLLFVGNFAIGISILLIGLVLFFFYYYGFVKMGKYTGERLLKLGSWITIVSVIVSVILIATVSLIVPGQLGNLSGLKSTLTIVSIVWVVVFLLILVGQMLFSTGLIKAGRQVKFAKVAGILNIVVFVSGLMFIAGAIMLVYAILNIVSSPTANLATLASLGALGTAAYVTVYAIIGLYVLKVVSMIFEFLCLFKSSKQFEN